MIKKNVVNVTSTLSKKVLLKEIKDCFDAGYEVELEIFPHEKFTRGFGTMYTIKVYEIIKDGVRLESNPNE